MKNFPKLLAVLVATFAFISSAKAAEEAPYTVVAGDILQISVWKEEALDREALVLPDGSLDFPLIGSVKAAGKTPSEIRDDVKAKLSSLIPDATISVTVKAATGHTVSVIGQVQKPGAYLMGHSLSVMEALSQAGGLTPFASEGSIRVLREKDGKKIAIDFPYDDVSEGDDLEKDIPLLPGDVVVVPTASLF